jgi:hypothetical protein
MRFIAHFNLNTTPKEVSVLRPSIMDPLSVTIAIIGLLKVVD